MTKRILHITPSLPNTFYGGGALTSYGIVISFLKKGYKVNILTWDNMDEESKKRAIAELDKLGVDIIILKQQFGKGGIWRYWKRIFFPCIGDMFPHFYSQDKVKKLLRGSKYNAVVAYHWEGLAATAGINSLPKIGLVGDPVDLPYIYRRVFRKYLGDTKINFSDIKNFFKQRYQRKFMKLLLQECKVCGAFAFHHAQMFRKWGLHHLRYFRTPIIDLFDNTKKFSLSSKSKILLIGHMKGIATLSGLFLFATQVFPILKRELGENNFEVHLIGDFFDVLPQKIKESLSYPQIKIRGRVVPISSEMVNADLLLVPTCINLGIRVRILTAFSFGTPVVAHLINKNGIPELEHNRNALLSNTGEGLAKEVIRLLRDKRLQEKLREMGRKTYQDYFSIEKAGAEIVRVVEEST